MRRVLHGDVSAAACVLFLLPEDHRQAALHKMLAEADAADAYRQCRGRLHPLWGNGSLMSAALARPHCAEPFLDDPDYAACMALVFTVLAKRRKPLP
ncbi:MAG: hypothetical protein GY945_15905 [Rhodobacteraceae bacterium]|nr:hypothetical protein [Paracoccaceae bacterium]